MKIAILEDNAERRDAMRDRLKDRFAQYETVFFAEAPAFLKWLRTQHKNLLFVGLDHDLEPSAPGRDPGTGREVADYLASLPPTCPVVIHSSNGTRAAGMEFALKDAGWTVSRVMPLGDLDWIASDWFPAVRGAIVRQAASLASGASAPA